MQGEKDTSRQCQQIKSFSSWTCLEKSQCYDCQKRKLIFPPRYEYFTMSGRTHLMTQEPPILWGTLPVGLTALFTAGSTVALRGEWVSCSLPRAAPFQYALLKLNDVRAALFLSRRVWVVPTKTGPSLPARVSRFHCVCLMVSWNLCGVCSPPGTRVSRLWQRPTQPITIQTVTSEIK